MSNITTIFGEFANEEEKTAFMESQFQVITNLNKEIEKLKSEKRQLEEQLKQSSPKSAKQATEDTVSSEEQICRDQLRMLNETSHSRELTGEESRKVDIYTKLLITLSNTTGKKKKSELDGLKSEDLLKLVENNDGSKTS